MELKSNMKPSDYPYAEQYSKRKDEPKFSQFKIAEYVCGWLDEQQVLHSVDDVEGALKNALGQLRDDQDGIVSTL